MPFVIALALGVLLAYGAASVVLPERIRARRFAGREELTTDEIYLRFYREKGISREQFGGLWAEAAKALSIAGGRMRPSDSFSAELRDIAFFPFADLNEEMTHVMMVRAKAGNIPLRDLERIRTLDDYILFFSEPAAAVQQRSRDS